MKTRIFATAIVGFVALTLLAPEARAGTAAFDKSMKPVLARYLTVHAALAGDKMAGVAGAGKKIVQLSKALRPGKVSGKHKAHYAALPKKIGAAAKKLARAKSLKAARVAFKELSRPMAMWATMSKPQGVNVLFCSMAKGSWLQADAKVRNPYYGAKMLTCGQIISGAHKGKASGHMKH